MAFTHTLIVAWQSGGSTIDGRVSSVGGLEVNVDEAIPENATDLQVAFALDVSQLKSLFIMSDKAIVIKTNSSSAPDNTFEIAADTPWMWNSGSGQALTDTSGAAVSSDVTKIYVTVTDAAALKIRALVDPTV